MTIAETTASLETTLAQQGLEDRVLSAHGISGLILTVASAPELIMPSEWLPLTFLDEEGPAFADKQSAERFHGDLMALWNAWNQVLDQEEPPALAECSPAYRLGEDDEPTPELKEFCGGVAMGHDWLQELWFDLIRELDNEENHFDQMYSIGLMSVLLLRDPEGLREAARKDGEDLDALTTEDALEALLPTLHTLGQIGRMASREQPDETGEAIPEPQENPCRHTDRNDPCPCGSGKKYKKCCLGGV